MYNEELRVQFYMHIASMKICELGIYIYIYVSIHMYVCVRVCMYV